MSTVTTLKQRLAELVAFDTQNPIGDERPLAAKLADDLRGCGATGVELFESEGHHSVYARFGTATPRLLINAHLDTVPANSGYTSPPLRLIERDDRLFGLGACDTKGAMAAILEALAARAAAGRRPEGVAVLFSGDEEKGSRCIRSFLASGWAAGIERAIVCEPTGCRAGRRHRGIGVAEATTTSVGGHSSLVDGMVNPLVTLARAAMAADAMGKRHKAIGPEGFRGVCLNVASLTGGIAFNVVPSRVTLTLSLRPAPGADVRALLGELEAAVREAAAPEAIEWRTVTANPSFAARDPAALAAVLGVGDLIDVPYWTEAALYVEKGIDAVVFGPGHIQQAHGADEFVEVAQLVQARDTFLRVLSA